MQPSASRRLPARRNWRPKRARLARAAEDSQLAPWQRDLMLRLARTGTTAAMDSSAGDPGDALPALAPCAADGAWTRPVPGLARDSHGAIYDPVRDRMVVFGGYSDISPSPFVVNDAWSLSLVGEPVWTRLTPSGTPPSARWAHSAIYDPMRDRMVVFGGISDSSVVNDVWSLPLAGEPAWTQLIPSGDQPSARWGHSAIYDPVRDRMVVFGGYSDVPSEVFDDVWSLPLAGAPGWTQLTPSGASPGGRADHSAIYDQVRDRMVVFAGYSSNSYLNDVWSMSLAGTPAWTQVTPFGIPPNARDWHRAIYDPVRGRMVVFGGLSGSALPGSARRAG